MGFARNRAHINSFTLDVVVQHGLIRGGWIHYLILNPFEIKLNACNPKLVKLRSISHLVKAWITILGRLWNCQVVAQVARNSRSIYGPNMSKLFYVIHSGACTTDRDPPGVFYSLKYKSGLSFKLIKKVRLENVTTIQP